eukprot:c12478_g1_i2.p1 GENE.c12478_g1_i2~~c12478_g1_i2.p1  ORF type:complete len:224 (+),score=45.75 c12478_g1_i2:43-714(+)
MKAIVVGATGATGSQVLAQLLENEAWVGVTAFTRRSLGKDSQKLREVLVDDFANLNSTPIENWTGHDAVFNCLGTTRGQAGSAGRFHEIEVLYSQHISDMAAKANIRHVLIVSAQGANHTGSGPTWFHPLFYVKTMGEKEQTAITKNFPRVSLFRPGFLDREIVSDRLLERLFHKIATGLPVSTLARAMIRDAEQAAKEDRTGVQYYTNSDIYALAAQATPNN